MHGAENIKLSVFNMLKDIQVVRVQTGNEPKSTDDILKDCKKVHDWIKEEEK